MQNYNQRRCNFTLVASPSGVNKTYTSCLIIVHSLHYVKHNVIHKTESTSCIALQSEEDWATARGNIQKIWLNLEMWFLRYASKHTNR